jgi:hypothetical protein
MRVASFSDAACMQLEYERSFGIHVGFLSVVKGGLS